MTASSVRGDEDWCRKLAQTAQCVAACRETLLSCYPSEGGLMRLIGLSRLKLGRLEEMLATAQPRVLSQHQSGCHASLEAGYYTRVLAWPHG